MALKTLMLKKKIDETRKKLESAMQKRSELETREAELEESINEAETDEEKAAVEEAVAEFEADKEANDKEVADFEEELEKLETELSETEERTQSLGTTPEPTPAPVERTKKMNRTKFFGMTMEERTAFFEDAEVKAFIERVREIGKEKRAVTGGQLLIPTVVLNLLRDNISLYSKLISKVNLQAVPGKARQNVLGVVPEAVWTEMCAKLNELNLGVTGVEVDGYKVGGFIPVCNALLEDSDENLAAVIIEALGKAIGYALDKAIVYGTGTKMPLGIVTRLVQTADPNSSNTTIPWVDLHTSNVVKFATTVAGVELFKKILTAAGEASNDYSKNGMFWVMNTKTKNKLMAESLSINAAGAVVAGVNGTMPVIGGEIVELSFVPDDVIVGGYGELYLLAERQGGEIAQSEHVRFTDDQTVFKGTARYDGLPVIAKGFVAIGINNHTVTANEVTFAADSANTVASAGSEG